MEAPAERARPWVPAALFLGALAVRLLFIAEQSQSPLFDFRGVDADRYHEMALGWMNGLWPGGRAFDWPPLYAVFLGTIYRWLGTDVALVKTIQAVIGATSCVLVHGIALRTFGRRDGAVVAAVLAALCGTLIYFDAELLTANLDLFLQLLSVYVLLRAAASGRLSTWALAGLVIGLAALLRGGALLFVPVVLVWIVLLPRFRHVPGTPRTTGLRVAAVLAPFLLVLAPVAWHNARYDVPLAEGAERLGAVIGPGEGRPTGETLAAFLAGGFLRTGSVAGFNLYLGNDPALRGGNDIRNPESLEAIGRIYYEPFDAGVTTLAEHDRYLRRKTLRTIAEDPLAWLRLVATKAFQLVHGDEIPRNRMLYADRAHSIVLRALLWKAGIAFPSGLLIPLGLVGVFLSRARWREHFLLLGVLAVHAALLVGFFVTARYRVPLLGVLSVYAGQALVAWPAYTRSRAGPWRKAAPFGLLAALLVVANWRVGPMPSEPFAFEYRAYGNHLREEGRLQEAIDRYREAVRLGGERAQPHFALGRALAEHGEPREAVRSLAEAVRIDPELSRGWMLLGAQQLALGQAEEAVVSFEVVARLEPGLPEAHRNLALALRRVGRFEEAKVHAAEARRLTEESSGEPRRGAEEEPGRP